MEGGKPENPEKYRPQSKDENQQQTQPTCDARSGNRTQARAVGGERSHHCTIPAPPLIEKTRSTGYFKMFVFLARTEI